MQVRQYLRQMGRLYFEGAISDFHPNLLRQFGGSLAMAAQDTQHIRIDPNSWLGIERRIQDRWTAAQIGWRRHVQEIRTLLNAGTSPTNAVYRYCQTFRTTPHTPSQIQQSLQRVMMSNGSQVSAWQVSTIEFRQRLRRGGQVMGDTFGAIGTMAALMMTADDWTRATPAEWDHALNAGEVAMVIGQMAGAHTDAHQQRRDTSAAARSAR